MCIFPWICLLALLLPLVVEAQPPGVLWKKTLGGSANDNGNDIIKTLDGGSLVVGSSSSSNGDVTGAHGLADVWVMKLDADGDLDWQKTYGGISNDYGSTAVATADGGYFIIGHTMSNDGDVSGNHGSLDNWVIRVNSVGTILWQKTYGGTGSDAVSGASMLGTGDLVIAGYTNSNNGDVSGNHGGTDYWLLRIDPAGTILSQKCFGGSSEDYALGVGLSSDGNVVLTGFTISTDGDVTGNLSGLYSGGWTIKTTPAGTLLWQRYVEPDDFGELWIQDVVTTNDGFIVAGKNSDGMYTDLWLVRYDEAGNKVWEKQYGGFQEDIAYNITTMLDGGFLVAGHTWDTPFDGVTRGWGNFWVMKIGTPGNIIWEKVLGGTAAESVHGAIVNTDGSMVIAGTSSSNDGDVSGNHGMSDVWVVKLDVDPALPVSLISFSAQPDDNSSVRLKWVTANEIDNAGFELEKSKDLKDIITVVKIPPVAKEGSTHNYTYTDETPFQGTSYYRLKQVDLDGKITIYSWRSVVVNQYYTIFPNPTPAKRFRLRLDEPGNAAIRIYDMHGNLIPSKVKRDSAGLVEIWLPEHTPPGTYLLHVTERGNGRQHRLVVE